jgi:hypothetical protein
MHTIQKIEILMQQKRGVSKALSSHENLFFSFFKKILVCPRILYYIKPVAVPP